MASYMAHQSSIVNHQSSYGRPHGSSIIIIVRPYGRPYGQAIWPATWPSQMVIIIIIISFIILIIGMAMGHGPMAIASHAHGQATQSHNSIIIFI